MLKWSVKLGEFDIQYVPRMAIKAQVVADFVLELTLSKVTPIDLPSNDGAYMWMVQQTPKGVGPTLF